MAFPQKTSLATAVTNRTTLDLSCQHVTTADFMQFNVAKALELVPKQPIEIDMRTFARLEPLPVPTFGNAFIHNRAYFVPFRTVWTAWDDFANDVPHIYDSGEMKQVTSVPLLSTSDISLVFADDDFSIEVADNEAYDFEYVQYNTATGNVTGTPWKGRFTPLGRQTYKLLRSLGYSVDFNNYRNFVSALPLLCLCRVYNDNFYPSAYANNDDSAWLQSFFKNNNDLLTDDTIFTEIGLKRIFKILTKVCYDSDYFTSAWDNPNAPNGNLASSMSVVDINDVTGENIVGYDLFDGKNAPVISNESNGAISSLSQFALNALRSMSDYMKRHQIVGSRVIDRFMARWGIKLKSEQLNRSMYLGQWKQDIKFGDVLSTSDTDGAQLGAFAGRGISFVDGKTGFNVNFDCEEHGMLIFTSTIVPVTQYYQGENRHCNHLTKLDFYTPEFDNLGTQAIACNELYTPIGRTIKGYRDKVFGFTPRYAEYKVPVSQITGDYVCNSMNVGKDSWTLFRDVSLYIDTEGLENLEHSMAFVEGNDREQYNRIFYNTSSSADHFNIIHDFNIKTTFPGKSLFDTYEFENEDKAQKVTVDVNGSKHN